MYRIGKNRLVLLSNVKITEEKKKEEKISLEIVTHGAIRTE